VPANPGAAKNGAVNTSLRVRNRVRLQDIHEVSHIGGKRRIPAYAIAMAWMRKRQARGMQGLSFEPA
jgi:hypothetical protein